MSGAADKRRRHRNKPAKESDYDIMIQSSHAAGEPWTRLAEDFGTGNSAEHGNDLQINNLTERQELLRKPRSFC